jgi:hypothetical protein
MRGKSLVSVFLLALAGCDGGAGQQTFRELALAPPSGYTRTDDQGAVLSTDPADWQVSPLYGPTSSVWVTVQPAYPNPVAPDGIATLVLNVRTGAVVGGVTAIGYVERAGQLPDSYVLDDVADARGFVTMALIPASQPAFLQGGGLRRIVVFDGQGEPVTYGDLLIE